MTTTNAVATNPTHHPLTPDRDTAHRRTHRALYDKVRDLRPDRQLASPLDESGRDPDDTNGGAPDDDGLFEMEGE